MLALDAHAVTAAAWNFQAEANLLGMLLAHNAHLHRVGTLAADDFYEGLHQRIFAAVRRTVEAGEVANPLTLGPEFDRDPALADLAGQKYLVNLVTSVQFFAEPEELARSVQGLAQKRRLVEACAQAVAAVEESPEVGFGEIAARLAASVQDIEGATQSATRTDYDLSVAIIADLKERLPAISTGLPRLDEAMGGGLYPGRSYGFAARKKVGKTALAATLSYNLAEQGVPHLFVAGEMGAKEIYERTLCRALNVYPSTFRGPGRGDPKFHTAIAAHARSRKRCAHYLDAPGLTFDRLRQAVASAVHRQKISGFILDYWQLVGGKPRDRSTSEHLDAVAQWVADFCRQHKLWSVTMAQVNQDGNTRGGEGIRLAFDQVYHLRGMGSGEDITAAGRWLEQIDTRYTKFTDVGSEDWPGLMLNERGPYFEHPPS